MIQRCITACLLAVLLCTGCASHGGGKKKSRAAKKQEVYRKQTGSNLTPRIDVEDEEAEAKKKEEKRKRKQAGHVDEDFVLRGGFR